MKNEIIIANNNRSAVPEKNYQSYFDPAQSVPVFYGCLGSFVGEYIAAAKDERMNTKRAIAASIASTERVHNQNELILKAYERELQRNDLSDEARLEILKSMSRVGELSNNENTACRVFLREQLEYSHKLTWKIFGIGIISFFGVIGGNAFMKAADLRH